MAYDNKFFPFASGAGANVQSDADYLADAERTVGNQPGVARSNFVNKSLKQACNFASLLADVIAMENDETLSDSISTSDFLDLFKKAVVKSFQNPIASENIISPTTSGDENHYAINLDSVSDIYNGDGGDSSTFPRIFCLSGLSGNAKRKVYLDITVNGISGSYQMRLPNGATDIPVNTFGNIPQLYIFCMLTVSGVDYAFLLNPPPWAYQGGTGRKPSANQNAVSVTVSNAEPPSPSGNEEYPLDATYNPQATAEVLLELSAPGGSAASAAVKLFQNDQYQTTFGTLPSSLAAFTIPAGEVKYITFTMLPGECFEVFSTGTAPTARYTSIVRNR
jgi:hypothetical protein